MKAPRTDSDYMDLALRLAARGRGFTSPNPMVGALIVAAHRIVGRGYHRRAGGPHAEAFALRQAGRRARGATLYATLEPCCHRNKRTPPCVPHIVEAGLRHVVVAMQDPHSSVSGRGIAALRRKGIRVEVGCQGDQARRLNEAYCHWVRTGRPFVVLKAAATLDGKIATAAGESRWITGEGARRHLHRLRSRVDAIMVGIGTVLRDDPWLTARRRSMHATELARRQPLRVIVDSKLRIPLTAAVLARVHGRRAGGTLVATTSQAPQTRLARLRSLGVSVAVLPGEKGRVSLRAALRHLGGMGITSVMIEGGSELNAAALRSGLVNRVMLYLAPLLLGGQDAKSLIGGLSPGKLSGARRLVEVRTRRVGPDLLIEGVPTQRGGPRSVGKKG